jgi:hypothetical protein
MCFRVCVDGLRQGGNPDGLAAFYDYLYGLSSVPEYTARTVNEALAVVKQNPTKDHTGEVAEVSDQGDVLSASAMQQAGPAASTSVVLVAHNGPHGLGNKAHNICGVDW